MSLFARKHRLSWAGCAVSALALAACAPPPPPAPVTWPAGTVLALNETPISAQEVDGIASMVARIEVHHTLPDLRRIALTNVVFPRTAARQVVGAERHDSLRAVAETWRAALERGETPGAPLASPLAETIKGGFLQLGLEVWNWALEAPLDTWSEPIETVGAWRLARVIQRSNALRPSEVVLEIDLRTFVWGDPETFVKELEDHLDHSKLTFVDETWRDLVPTLWQRRLRGSP